jgi:hypothetical protein
MLVKSSLKMTGDVKTTEDLKSLIELGWGAEITNNGVIKRQD